MNDYTLSHRVYQKAIAEPFGIPCVKSLYIDRASGLITTSPLSAGDKLANTRIILQDIVDGDGYFTIADSSVFKHLAVTASLVYLHGITGYTPSLYKHIVLEQSSRIIQIFIRVLSKLNKYSDDELLVLQGLLCKQIWYIPDFIRSDEEESKIHNFFYWAYRVITCKK